ncbi:alanine racemase [Francisellaceae bacterium]|nr:alanine racemase [Francisellaceae bacterium]
MSQNIFPDLRAYVTINRDNLKHNFQVLKNLNPDSKIICMVKANAYGHDSVYVAKALDKQTSYFGVASIEGAIKLVESNIKAKVLIFSGFFCKEQISVMKKFHLIPVIHSIYQLQLLLEYAPEWGVELWLKINSGMNRLGLSEMEFEQANKLLTEGKHHLTGINLISHLAESHDEESQFTLKQINYFKFLSKYKIYDLISINNSAASIIYPDPYFNTVRFGISLYGISTLSGETKRSLDLKPVMTFKSQIIAIQKIKQGESVGYDRNWFANVDSIIAIIPVGYGDGYPQHATNGTPILIKGRECPLVGNVSMDMLAVDITSLTDINIGEPVTLWGEGLPVEKVAKAMQFSPYGLVAGIRRRVYHHFI